MIPRDMWILPSGEMLSVSGSHGHTAARWFKLVKITAHEGLERADASGWIRVVGHSAEFALELTVSPTEGQWRVLEDIVATKNKNKMRLIIDLTHRRGGRLVERTSTIDAGAFEPMSMDRLREWVAAVYGVGALAGHATSRVTRVSLGEVSGAATAYETAFKNVMSPDYQMVMYDARAALVKKYAWAVPSGTVLEALREWEPYTEIMAGKGYWAYEMQKRGMVVHPTDLKPDSWKPTWEKSWTSVEKMEASDAAKLAAQRGDTLLVIWPYMDDAARRAVVTYRQYGGRWVVYCGEGYSGCTGTGTLHWVLGAGPKSDETVAQAWDIRCFERNDPDATNKWNSTFEVACGVSKLFTPIRSYNIPQWHGIHDYVSVHKAR